MDTHSTSRRILSGLARMFMLVVFRLTKARAVSLIRVLVLLLVLSLSSLWVFTLSRSGCFRDGTDAFRPHITECSSCCAGPLKLVERWLGIGEPSRHDSSIWVIANSVVGVTEAVKADLPSHRERNHLIPVGRKISVSCRPQDIIREDVVALSLWKRQGLDPNTLHSHGRHVVCVALGRLVDANLLELALCIMSTTRVFHLRNELDHGVQCENTESHGLEDPVLVCDAELGFQDLDIAVVLYQRLDDLVQRGLMEETVWLVCA